MDLSIIVLVYNVEKYIRPCIESIFKQGLNDTDFEGYLKVNRHIKAISFLYIRKACSLTNAYKIENSKDFIIAIARTWELKQIKGVQHF